jgi:hypothetical protein
LLGPPAIAVIQNDGCAKGADPFKALRSAGRKDLCSGDTGKLYKKAAGYTAGAVDQHSLAGLDTKRHPNNTVSCKARYRQGGRSIPVKVCGLPGHQCSGCQ